MTGFNKVFLDTTPLIYFLDSDVSFGEKTRAIFEEIISTEKSIVTSVITCMEYLTYPYKTGNQDKIDAFFEFVQDCDIHMLEINTEIATMAAVIRAEYKGFKGMDSLQLAAAVYGGCDLFLTNDNQLRQYKGLKCITIEEWKFMD